MPRTSFLILSLIVYNVCKPPLCRLQSAFHTGLSCYWRVHIGTITLLIIKHDEQTGNFRDKTGVLKDYSSLNKLPRVSQRYMLINL